MKKILFVMFMLLILTGCGTCLTLDKLAINRTAERVAAIELGYRIAKNNPVLVKQALPYANGLLTIAQNGNLSKEQLRKAIQLLNESVASDPIVVTLISDVVNQMDTPIEKGVVNGKIISLLQAFINGIEQGGK